MRSADSRSGFLRVVTWGAIAVGALGAIGSPRGTSKARPPVLSPPTIAAGWSAVTQGSGGWGVPTSFRQQPGTGVAPSSRGKIP